MKIGKKGLAGLLTLALCLALVLPARAAEVTFTAINDSVLKLSAETMPIWSGGVLYAPYTTFDATANGMKWDIECIYTKGSGKITVLNLSRREFLEFDLKDGTCRDGLTGEAYEPGAILRSGQPYLPVETVCDYFGLSYSYREISQGNLLRIKNEDVVLSDRTFVEAATNVLDLRLQEYNQSQSTGETAEQTPAPSVTPSPEQPKDDQSVPTYLAFRCADADATQALLISMEGRTARAMFFVTPELAAQRGDLILRMLGEGHSVGLLAQGDSLEETRRLLEAGSQALEEQAFLRTTVAYTGAEYRDELEKAGWICWNRTLDLTPGDNDGPNYFSYRVINQLSGRTSAVYLSLEASANTMRILPTLLVRLEERGYDLALPLETRL